MINLSTARSSMAGAILLAASIPCQAGIISVTPGTKAIDTNYNTTGGTQQILMDFNPQSPGTFGNTTLLNTPGTPANLQIALMPQDMLGGLTLPGGFPNLPTIAFIQAGTGIALSNTTLAAGTVVDATTQWNTGGGIQQLNGNNPFIGIRVQNGASFNYGWLQYSIGSVIADAAGLNTTTGSSITTSPALASVPLPPSFFMLAMAMGGLAFWRKQRS